MYIETSIRNNSKFQTRRSVLVAESAEDRDLLCLLAGQPRLIKKPVAHKSNLRKDHSRFSVTIKQPQD